MSEVLRRRARERIGGAPDEIVAQGTVQVALIERQDTGPPVLITDGVVEWVRRVSPAPLQYGEGAYERAAEPADITRVGEAENGALRRWGFL